MANWGVELAVAHKVAVALGKVQLRIVAATEGAAKGQGRSYRNGIPHFQHNGHVTLIL